MIKSHTENENEMITEDEADSGITKEEIAKIAKKLNNKKAHGIDGTNNKGLKILHKKHPEILINLIQRMHEIRDIPRLLKSRKISANSQRKRKKRSS